ncbi:MAG: TIGR03619 family F420-dependent LLM class oxidoreductase [Pseudomonadota bacterium]|nr:TIGR03619 family F420-dependent LLM class oxidoreductase [Pseudomonadota bacterium]
MKFAIPLSILPTNELLEITLQAEKCGFDSVATSDHLIHPKNFSVPYPYTEDGKVRWEEGTDWPDPINLFSYLAGATTKINFYTSVYILPARNPLRAAKEISTLANFSNGRFSLGIGMGWMPEEFQVGEQAFRMRGKRADEMIEVMKKLWSGDMHSFDGEFYNYEPLEMLPKPNHKIPILVGGFSKPAIRRAAQHDGWVSDLHSLEELEALIKKIKQERKEKNKTGEYQIIAFSCWDAFSADGFKKMQELGVTTITTYPWMLYGVMNEAPLQDKLDGLKRFSDEIINKF